MPTTLQYDVFKDPKNSGLMLRLDNIGNIQSTLGTQLSSVLDTYRPPSMADKYLEETIAKARNYQRPTDKEYIDAETTLNSPGVNPNELEAAKLAAKLGAKKGLRKATQELPTPQQEELVAPTYPDLNLPGVPTRPKVEQDPVASIAAAIFGLISPQNAGQFGTAALDGAIQANEKRYADLQRQFAQETQLRTAFYEDAVRRADVEANIANKNKQVRFENSAAELAKKMKDATEEAEINELEGYQKPYADAIAKQQKIAEAQSAASTIIARMKMGETYDKRAMDAAELKARLESQEAIKQQNMAYNAQIKAAELEAKKAEAKAKADAAASKPITLGQGAIVVNPITGDIIARGQPKQFAPKSDKFLTVMDKDGNPVLMNANTREIVGQAPPNRYAIDPVASAEQAQNLKSLMAVKSRQLANIEAELKKTKDYERRKALSEDKQRIESFLKEATFKVSSFLARGGKIPKVSSTPKVTLPSGVTGLRVVK